MSKVSGTGCMLSVLTGACCAVSPSRHAAAAAAATALMGTAGEFAYERLLSTGGGTLTYRTFIVDEISSMSGEKFKEAAKIESR
jgi:hydroxyethylthiazole kinase